MTHTYPHSQPRSAKDRYSSFPTNSCPGDRAFGDRASRVAAAFLLCGGVAGGLLSSQMAWANPVPERVLLAQQIVDGLPPPPPLIFGQEAIPGSQSPAPLPQSASTGAAAAQRYLVVVNGDSPLLLSQVQAIAPGAALQDYQGQRFIQAGLFNDASQAQQQVTALASRGIGAQVVTMTGAAGAAASAASAPSAPVAAQTVSPPDLLPVAPVPREVEFGQPPPDLNQLNPPAEDAPEPEAAQTNSSNRRSFYVVIPGKSDNLTSISNQIIRLGDGFGIAQLVQENDTPRGSHIQVGPFVDRQAASRWSRYFREFGLDARVYYRR